MSYCLNIASEFVIPAVGALGGGLRAFLGYKNTDEPFKIDKAVYSMVRAGIAGAAVVYKLNGGLDVADASTIMTAFITAVGAETFVHDVYGMTKDNTR